MYKRDSVNTTVGKTLEKRKHNNVGIKAVLSMHASQLTNYRENCVN